MSLTIHIAWACGYLAFMGLPGFANAEEVSRQQMTLNSIQLSQITNSIRDEKRQMCMASKQGNQSALTSWSMALGASTGQYHALTQQWPQVMTCDDLLVSTPPSDGPT